MKILAIAYACEPNKGSEALVGWKFSEILSSIGKTIVITRQNNQSSINDYINKNPNPNLFFEYVDLPKMFSFWKKKKRGIMLYYFLWQILAYFKAKEILKKENIDFIHSITFTNFYAPCFTLRLKRFGIGPLAGVYDLPFTFFLTMPIKEKLKYLFQKIMRFFILINPFSKIKKAAFVLAANQETYNFIKKINKNVFLMPAIGISHNEIISKYAIRLSFLNPLIKILCSGELVKNKGFDLAILAFAKFIQLYPNSQLDIYGDGPEKKKLEKIIKSLKIKLINIYKPLPREDYLKKIEEYDIILHPAYRESGAFVLLEALSKNIVPIAFNVQGPSLIIPDNFGFKIELSYYSSLAQKIATAINEIEKKNFDNKNCKIKEIFFWEYKQKKLKEIYENIIHS